MKPSSQTIDTRIAEYVPDCLTSFSAGLIAIHKQSGDFRTRFQLGCLCQNRRFFVEAAQEKQLKGVCSLRAVIARKMPVELACSECKKRSLLLDASIHGLKAETTEVFEPKGRPTMVRCSPQPVALNIEFEYCGLEHLSITSANQHWEDFFTCVRIMSCRTPGTEFTELLRIEGL